MDRAILYPGIYGPGYFMPELRKCVKVEVVVQGSPSLIVLMVSVDVKQHSSRNTLLGKSIFPPQPLY